MIVKPSLLRLYEQFLIPIAHLLKHGLKGLILGILPLLEEENNEFFDKGLSLLDLVEQKSKDFYPSLWLGLCQSSQLRLGGCHYLQRKLKKLEQKDISLVLIDCITQMLLDPQPLVNRGILDILVQKIPIDYIQSQELMRAAISVLLKRDSSLNRRLFQWLDTEQNEEKAQVLIGNAIRSMMQDADVGKPYQIMVSLMDKPGGHVVFENLFIDMIQSTMTNPNAINFMSMLNESVEPFVLWKQFSLYISDLNQQKLDLFHFYFDQYHTQDEQSEKIHKPYFIYLLSLKLSDGHYLDSLLSLISKLLSQLPKSVFTTSWHLSDLKTRKPDITSPLSATSPLMYIPDEIIYEPWTVNQEDILLMYTMEEEQLKSLYTRLLIGEPILSTSLETIARKIQAEKSHYKVWSKILQLFYTNGSKIEPWMYDFMKSDDLETFVCILKTLEKIKARLKDPKPMFDQVLCLILDLVIHGVKCIT
ncbi:Dopey, N-terminal-domain-containing protein [Gorgonomyces haynaldii]|nr:Dopey, N-terminal-domain-containing protein [Gorgonomyces haynaldii]